MAERYAENVPKLADYLWWLLPTFCKRKPKHESWLYRFMDVWGEQFEGIRERIETLNLQFTAETAEDKQLDEIGKARGTWRLPNESDEDLRQRVLDAYLEKQKDGTTPGMIQGLGILGFGIDIEELYKTDPSRWSEFIVKVFTWNGINSQDAFYDEVNRLKPAHTRMLTDPALELEVFDDNGFFDTPDGSGRFDGWSLP